MRIRRTVLEQLLRNGKKYRCKNCRHTFFVKKKEGGKKDG